MATKDAFTGAKAALIFLDAFADAAAQEIGKERALALMTKTCETLGAMQGRIIKQQAGDSEIDARRAWPLLRNSAENFGIAFEIVEDSPKRVVIRSGRCPMFEAAQALGLDAKDIEARCRATTKRFDDMLVKQLNPNLSFRLMKFKSAADDYCEEELVQE